MARALIIAIDGPAASGKSTLAQRLARELDYLYFDTGILYRTMTLAVLRNRIDIQDAEAVSQLAERVNIEVDPVNGHGQDFRVLLDGQDVTTRLRSPKVDANVSVVSAYPRVRQALNEQQRRIGMRGGIVMVGRDIGTVVLPEADLKIYLDASVEERAHRRYQELLAAGAEADYDQIEESIRQRDRLDAERAIAPLRPADDAEVIHTDGLEIEEVLARAQMLAAAQLAQR